MSAKNLKQRIRDGELIYGVSVPVSANRDEMKAIIDKDHYDFVMADSQHTAYDERQLVEYCNIADSLDIPVHFRIKHTRNAYLIGNYLDLGPSGIEVPQVELESTVEEAVTWFYYPQIGIRSAGGGRRKGIAERSDRLGICELVESIRCPLDAVRIGFRSDQCTKTCQAGRGLSLFWSRRPHFQHRKLPTPFVKDRR